MVTRRALVLALAMLSAPRIATQSDPSAADGAAAYAAVVERVAAWQRAHPDLVRREPIGASHEGRPLFVLRISAAADGAPEVYVGGGIHGHEGSERDALWLGDAVLAHADVPQVRRWLETRVLWLQPLVNPDGVFAHTRHNARGVDLNRNFGGRWQPGAPGRTWPGPEPFSEPESRAVRDFLQGRTGLRAFVDLHRSATLLVVPTVEDAERAAEVLEAGRTLAAAMGGAYATRGALRLEPLHGLAIDWACGSLGVHAFVWEMPYDDADGPVERDPRWRGLAHLLTAASEFPSAGSSPREFDFDAAWREVVARFRAGCEAQRVVGASLMFVEGGEVRGFDAYGAADLAGGRAVDRDTIYHWASITKTLTGITAMQLRDRGRLALDDRIVRYVPELGAVHDPAGWLDRLTVRHLLAHTGGFRSPTWPWGGDQPWHPHEPTEFAQLVAMMPYTAIEFEPGSRYRYSNPGIVFVGRAIERLTGDDYEVHVDKNLLRPLGMARSYFDVTPYHLQRDRSHSYRLRGDEVEDLGPDFDTGVTVSNGGLNAPLPDMARYLAFLLGACEEDSDAARVLARASLDEMWEPVVASAADRSERMGLTFFLQERGGQPFVTHTGGQRGFVTFFYVHPASGTGALGAFNTGSAGPVMAAVRRACMDELSLPMARR